MMNATVSEALTLGADQVVTRPVRSEIESILDDTVLVNKYAELLSLVTPPSESAPSPFTIGVTACHYGEGATSVAIGLASVLAYRPSTRVTLLDFDLGWPAVHRRLDLPASPGVGELAAGRASRDDAMRQTILPGLTVLAAGKRPQRGIEKAAKVAQWLARFKRAESPDYVVLDLPPANVDLGTSVLSSTADALFLVVRGGVTPTEELRAALTRLEGQPLAAVVMTDPRPDLPGWLARRLGKPRDDKTQAT